MPPASSRPIPRPIPRPVCAPPSTLWVRPRVAADIAPLAAILTRQWQVTECPFEWPLPYPIEQFLRRDGEIAAWVAELDGEVVGHAGCRHIARGCG